MQGSRSASAPVSHYKGKVQCRERGWSPGALLKAHPQFAVPGAQEVRLWHPMFSCLTCSSRPGMEAEAISAAESTCMNLLQWFASDPANLSAPPKTNIKVPDP